MATAAALLLETRLSTGLSARALARLARTAPARVSEIERSVHDPSVGTLDRLLAPTGRQLVTLPSVSPTAAAVGTAIHGRAIRDERDENWAFRVLLSLSDGLAAASPDVRVALCVTAPPLTGDPRFDAALAGIVEHHLRKDRLPVPSWVTEDARSLAPAEAWIPDRYADADIADDAPAALRRHGVFLAERELHST